MAEVLRNIGNIAQRVDLSPSRLRQEFIEDQTRDMSSGMAEWYITAQKNGIRFNPQTGRSNK